MNLKTAVWCCFQVPFFIHWIYLHERWNAQAHMALVWRSEQVRVVYTYAGVHFRPVRCSSEVSMPTSSRFQRRPCKSTCVAAVSLLMAHTRRPTRVPTLTLSPLHATCSACIPPPPSPTPSQNESSAAAHREYHFIFHSTLVFLGFINLLWVIFLIGFMIWI